MRCLPLILLGIVAISMVAAVPTPFLGMEELLRPSFSSPDGRLHAQSFTHTNEDGTTRLHYKVEHASGFRHLHLDAEDGVLGLDCSGLVGDIGELRVRMATRAAAEDLANEEMPIIISGGRGWGCVDSTRTPRSVLHKGAGRPSLVSETVVGLPVVRADLTDVFKHADVEFYTDKFPEGHFKRHDHANAGPEPSVGLKHEAGRALLSKENMYGGWLKNVLTRAWGAVKSVGKVVNKAVLTVQTAIQVVMTGDYEYSGTPLKSTWSWNVLRNGTISRKNVPIDGSVNCNNCGATATLALEFSLKISNYQLVAIRQVASGSMAVAAGVDGPFTYSKEYSNSTILTTIYMDPVIVTVGGVPFAIDVSIPITAGYDVVSDVDGYVTASGSMQGGFQFGMAYTPKNGMTFISSHDFDYSASLQKLNTRLATNVVVYVLPTVVFQIDYIGGPTVGIKPFVEVAAAVNASLASTDPCFLARGASVTSNLGIQVTIGARVSVGFPNTKPLYEKEFDPTAVYSTKMPVLSGCLVAGELETPPLGAFSGGHAGTPLMVRDGHGKDVYANVVSPGCAVGNTWTAVMTRGPGYNHHAECTLYPPIRHVSFQAVDTVVTGSGPLITMVGSVNDNNPGDPNNSTYACVNQQQWVASVYSGGMLTFQLDTDQPAQYYACSGGQATCTCNAPQTAMPSSFYGNTDADFNIITVEDTLRCTQLNLTRTTKHTNGALYRNARFDGPDPCGMGPGPGPSPPPPPGGCCGGLPANQCSLPSGAPCNFGCQCLSGNCPGTCA